MFSDIKKILTYLNSFRKYFWMIILAIPFSFITSSYRGALALISKEGIDKGIIGEDINFLIKIAIVIIALSFASNLGRIISNYLISLSIHSIIKSIRERIFKKILHIPLNKDINSAETVSKVLADTEVILTLPDVVKITIKEPISFLILAGILIYMNYKLALFSLASFLAITFPVNYISKKIRKASHKTRISADKISGKIIESIQGAKVVRTYSPHIIIEKFKEHIENFKRNMVKSRVLGEVTSAISDFSGAVVVSFIVVFAGHQIFNNEMTIGEFLAFFGATVGIWEPIKNMLRVPVEVARIAPSLTRIQNFENLSNIRYGKIKKYSFEDYVEFKDVSVSFNGKTVLNKVNITIRKGDRISLIGSSGVGKTTFVSLIPRFFDPTEGEIIIDGYKLTDLDEDSLRSLVCFVEQEPFIFDDTIYSNVVFARPEAKYQEVEEALIKAGLSPDTFPGGLNFRCGENGKNLSVGQKHRIAISRAFLKNSPIVIMDEPTASLDPKVEEEIMKTLEELFKSRTVIIISHKLKTAIFSSRFILIENGKIYDVDRERIMTFFLSC